MPLASEAAAFSARVLQATTSKKDGLVTLLAPAVAPGAVDGEGGRGLALCW